MIEKTKIIMNKGRHFSVLLTYLSKVFDSLSQDLLMAKLDVYGFKNDALYLMCNYLNNRKQRAKIYSSFSSFQTIISGDPQNSLWVLCYLTFFSQSFFFFVLLKLQTMLITTHHAQREIVFKNFAKSRRSLKHFV